MTDITRSSGILMAVSSLPSPYGIGTLGKAAYEFVDFLAAAGQKYWQILPVGPTGYGDSPYQSFSSFAGNPYFVDLDMLIDDGLLKQEEVDSFYWGADSEQVDYAVIYENRFEILRIAAARGLETDQREFDRFCENNRSWLSDYALYMAVKKSFGQKIWTEWPDDGIRLHREKSCEEYRLKLKEDVQFYSYIQFLFFGQWEKLRAYARKKGIQIIGDIPIYVSMDSSDIWAEPEWFQLDSDNRPIEISGVPPDYFNEDGQLWGNPLYAWDAMEKDGFGWWIRRVDGAAKLYDIVRIDHFRGFESYWSVKADETTAKNGRWIQGPGMKVIGTLKNWFQGVSFIAEDLGYLNPSVRQLLAESGFPGMKILEFVFNKNEGSAYKPHRYTKHCVCYTGTHDNPPIGVWKESIPEAELQQVIDYFGLNSREGFIWGMIRGGMSSVADLFIAQMQDYLELGDGSRMNTPGTTGNNWMWRMKKGAATEALAKRIAVMTDLYGRRND